MVCIVLISFFVVSLLTSSNDDSIDCQVDSLNRDHRIFTCRMDWI